MTDFSGVGGLPQLVHLETTNTPIESLSGLATATNLTTLSIGYSYSPIFSSNLNVLAPISSLTALVSLQIRSTSLTNEHFANVAISQTVTNLALPDNLLVSLDNLTYLDNLRSLDLRDNKLRSLENAQLITKLTNLQVENTNHGYGNNEAIFGVGTNSIIDFSPVSISHGGNNLTLYLARQSGRATFTFSSVDNLFIYDLGSIKPPVSSTAVPTVTVSSLSQGAHLNTTLNRLELTPEQYTALNPSQEIFQASIRSPFSILGVIWMYPEAPQTHTVEYTDGLDGIEVFPNQTHTGLTPGSTTPAFTGTPTRTGFTFVGWQPSVAATVTANVTYTALWEAIIHTDPSPVDPSPGEPGAPETQHPPTSQPGNGSLSHTGSDLSIITLLAAGIVILTACGALLIARTRQRRTDEIVK